MKKISITCLVSSLLLITGVGAQTVADGVNDLYAERYKGAKATFEKLIAANPSNIEASYWLGQAYIGMNDVKGARDIYSKALMTSANAPLLLVGMGQVELLEKNQSAATQRFETAITLTRNKKGDDPVILDAIGRGITNTYNTKEKNADINYAVEKLETAAQKDPNSADIYLNLGNAYLKAKPGEGGGNAFTSYNKATSVNPNFAIAYYRLAKLFESQRNWELYEKYLMDAITKDPKFAPAYYELSYYNLLRKDQDMAAARKYAQLFKQNADPDPQNAYLEASIEWAQGSSDMKKGDKASARPHFTTAIAIANDIISKAGNDTKARVYKLIADSKVQMGDTASAKAEIDQYFAKADPDEVTALDYGLKAKIYSAIPGQEEVLYATYLEGVKEDTVLDNKISLLKEGAALFKARGMREKEGDLTAMMIPMKPKPSINDMYDATRAYYFGQAYDKSVAMADKLVETFPNEIYGYDWRVNNYRILDSTYANNKLIPAATAEFEFAKTDTAKYKKYMMSAAGILLNYYANEARDKEKALFYVDRMIEMDPTNTSLPKIRQQIENPPRQQTTPPKRNTPPRSGNSSSSNNNKRSSTSNSGG
ncbi:MAG: tetratricopeptide repeat protein [Bacteroidetes bacterium]|nr:MAG: tetratricopeptide repeat protein [Bacteroidota bacterium]